MIFFFNDMLVRFYIVNIKLQSVNIELGKVVEF